MFEQTFKTVLGMHKVLGGICGDFFNFYCEKCGARTRVKFICSDGEIPKLESACKCGELYQFKTIIFDMPKKNKIEEGEKNNNL